MAHRPWAPRLWGRRIGRAGATAIIFGLSGIVAWTFATSWHPSDRNYRYQGIDVSAAMGPIDWWTVKAGGAQFGYIRATIAADERDPQFPVSWADIFATGMRRGAIHVYSLCRLAADQANNFNTTVPHVSDALPAAIDIDFADDCPARPTRAVVLDELRRLITMIEAHTGKPVLLKLSQRFETTYRVSGAIPRSIWSVQSFFPPAYAARPWRMWQASDMRRIDGANGPVHWDVVAP